MKLITKGYISHDLEKDFKYAKNADVYEIYTTKLDVNIDLINIFISKYFPMLNIHKDDVYKDVELADKLRKYIEEKYKSPLVYKAISRAFISDYVIINNISQ